MPWLCITCSLCRGPVVTGGKCKVPGLLGAMPFLRARRGLGRRLLEKCHPEARNRTSRAGPCWKGWRSGSRGGSRGDVGRDVRFEGRDGCAGVLGRAQRRREWRVVHCGVIGPVLALLHRWPYASVPGIMEGWCSFRRWCIRSLGLRSSLHECRGQSRQELKR